MCLIGVKETYVQQKKVLGQICTTVSDLKLNNLWLYWSYMLMVDCCDIALNVYSTVAIMWDFHPTILNNPPIVYVL